MPMTLPKLDEKFFREIKQLSFPEMALALAKSMIGAVLDDTTLKAIIDRAFDFPVVLQPVSSAIDSLELWHGPSLAFKDFGARFTGRTDVALQPKQRSKTHHFGSYQR